MFRNYLLTTIRNISRNKLFTFLNVAGLAVGLVSCLFIYLYVTDELSFDKQFSNSDRIYRLQSFFRFNDTEDKFGLSSYPVVPTLMNEFPEIEDGTRLFVLNAQNVKIDESVYEIENVYFADSNFFNVFDFRFIEGDLSSSLSEPKSIVLTSTEAARIFGRDDAVGKLLEWNSQTLRVTGVISDELNTHIALGAFISMSTMSPQSSESLKDNWGMVNSYSYLLLNDKNQASAFQPKLDHLVENFVLPRWRSFGFDGEINMYAEPLKDIHFNNYLIYDTPKKGNKTYVYVFSVVAVLILLLACINFINLSIAAATKRTKEVAVRKVAGAGRSQLVRQFLGEGLVIALISALVAMTLLELFLPMFNSITEKGFSTRDVFGTELLLVLTGLILFISFTAGSYPAFVIARLSPDAIFRQRQGSTSGNTFIRKVLVTSQFVLSLCMVAGTIAVFSQLSFLRDSALGFDRDNKMVLSLPPGDSLQSVKLKTLKSELLSLSQVESASRSAHIPGGQTARFVFKARSKNGGPDERPMAAMFTDAAFMKMMKMELKEGEFFDESSGDSPQQNVVMINEAAVAMLGWENPLQEKMYIPGDANNPDQELRITGVLRDFNFKSLHEPVEPLAVLPQHPMGNSGSLVVGLKPGNLSEAISVVEGKWKQVFPNKPFEYTFLDETLKKMYVAEEKMFRVFIYFASIALILSCLGLYGLSAFAARQRTKEIGVRKVLGASVSNILLLVNRDFFRLFILSCVIAFPITWLVINKWLENFAYHTEISIWYFLIPAIFVLLITLLTVTHQALKAALINPVHSLRYE